MLLDGCSKFFIRKNPEHFEVGRRRETSKAKKQTNEFRETKDGRTGERTRWDGIWVGMEARAKKSERGIAG